MKPNFALSLSFEGIRLLHRAADGWRVVGDVGLDSSDLAGELAVLRAKASDLDAAGVRTKLIIPNDQIKYITLETGDLDLADRTGLAVDALDGATPYTVDELAYSVSADGSQTHIAAVARETLAEAEAFAKDHRFHPVSWVAIPDEATFVGEPFFGATDGAPEFIGDATVEAGGEKITILGDVIVDDGPVVIVEDTAAIADDTAAIANDAQPDVVDASQAPEPELEATPEPESDTETEKPATEAKAEEPLADPEPAVDAKIEPPQDGAPEAQTTPAPAVKDDPSDQEASVVPAPVVFARRDHTQDPPARNGRSVPPPLKAPEPTKETPKDEPAAKKPFVFFSSLREPEGDTPALAGATRNISAPLGLSATRPSDGTAEAETQGDAAAAAGFFSRRKKPKSEPIPAPVAVTTKASSEAERLTVFGARKADKPTVVGGKPRFLGLILMVVLLLFLAGVAAWASVFMDEGLARFFGSKNDRTIATAPEGLAPAPQEESAPTVTTASLSTGLSSEDAAVLDALRAPQSDPVVVLPELSPQELIANYAVTGIWPKAPEVPQPAPLISLEDIYVASIDPISSSNDAVALPNVRSLNTDRPLGEQNAPASAGTAFALGTNGLVVPTPEGAVTPDGVLVFLGRPAAVPPKTPARPTKPAEIDPALVAIAKIRPQPRPANLVEQNERSSNGGLSRSELAELRPVARPALKRVETAPEPEEVDSATETAQTDAAAAAAAASLAALPPRTENIINEPANPQAVQASVRPDGRPKNFARIVKRAIAKKPEDDASQGTRVASVAPRTVTPKIPSSASVAKSATVKNAINLGKVNLIGVYGKPSSRRALVRLSNGRYQKVKVGDRIDGGRVSAIGDNELRYKKGSRNLTLKMPKS
jgi:hypothetical protein